VVDDNQIRIFSRQEFSYLLGYRRGREKTSSLGTPFVWGITVGLLVGPRELDRTEARSFNTRNHFWPAGERHVVATLS